jgi:hypothetical protein
VGAYRATDRAKVAEAKKPVAEVRVKDPLYWLMNSPGSRATVRHSRLKPSRWRKPQTNPGRTPDKSIEA